MVNASKTQILLHSFCILILQPTQLHICKSNIPHKKLKFSSYGWHSWPFINLSLKGSMFFGKSNRHLKKRNSVRIEWHEAILYTIINFLLQQLYPTNAGKLRVYPVLSSLMFPLLDIIEFFLNTQSWRSYHFCVPYLQKRKTSPVGIDSRTLGLWDTVGEVHAILPFSRRSENSDWILQWWSMGKNIF